MRYFICCLIFFGTITLQSQEDYVKTGFRYEDYVYNKDIKTVLLHKDTDPLSYPSIGFRSGDVLKLSFDDLSNDPKDLYYEIILCNYDWSPSDLLSGQYLDGSPENLLNNYVYSACNYSRFIHYEVSIPNESIQLTRSGNYVLKVYQNNDKEDLILSKRFIIYESILSIKTSILRVNDAEKKYTDQLLNFSINTESMSITNPYQNLHVSVLQNFNWLRSDHLFSPTFIKGSELEYSSTDRNMRPGGHEFRNLDLKSTVYKSMNVRDFVLENPIKTSLLTDERRSHKAYEFTNDLNGKKYIRNELGFNHAIEAEYMQTFFSISMEKPLSSPLYISGSVCDFPLSEDCKMQYNTNTKAYEKAVFVKQGFHNYAYATLENNQLSYQDIEGEHWETENDYIILVYYRGFTDRHDRLVGYRVLSTREN